MSGTTPDFALPTSGSSYGLFALEIRNNMNACSKIDPSGATTLIEGAIRLKPTDRDRFQRWDGADWDELVKLGIYDADEDSYAAFTATDDEYKINIATNDALIAGGSGVTLYDRDGDSYVGWGIDDTYYINIAGNQALKSDTSGTSIYDSDSDSYFGFYGDDVAKLDIAGADVLKASSSGVTIYDKDGDSHAGFGADDTYYINIAGSNYLIANTSGIQILKRVVVDSSTSAVLTSANSGNTYTNIGSTGKIAFTLPTAAAGLEFSFCRRVDYNLAITAAAGDYILESTSAGSLTCSTSGETYALVTLLAVDAMLWTIMGAVGTWTTT